MAALDQPLEDEIESAPHDRWRCPAAGTLVRQQLRYVAGDSPQNAVRATVSGASDFPSDSKAPRPYADQPPFDRLRSPRLPQIGSLVAEKDQPRRPGTAGGGREPTRSPIDRAAAIRDSAVDLLRRLLTVRRGVRIWLPFVLLCTVDGGLAGFGVALVMPPSYASTVEVLIAPPLNSSTSVNINDIQASQALVPTYAELASSRILLDRVIASTGVATTSDRLAGAVSTHVPEGTNLLQITVSNRDPSSAAKLANAIAAELATYQISGTGVTTGSAAVTVTVVDPAVPPTKPQGLGALFTAALGAAVGLMMAISFAFLVENLRHDNGPAADRA